MKKIIVLLSVILLIITGCSMKELSSNDFEKNMDILLNEKTKSSNVHFDGYKYYVPDGLKFINKEEYNAILKDRFDNKYYMYVDVISYYHKVKNTYKIKQDAYYSRVINYGNKTGYLEITEDNGKYFVEFVFNYAKIESLTDKILESIVGDNVLSYAEEVFTLFDTTSSQEDFLEVVSRYDPEYKKAIDQEELELDEE